MAHARFGRDLAVAGLVNPCDQRRRAPPLALARRSAAPRSGRRRFSALAGPSASARMAHARFGRDLAVAGLVNPCDQRRRAPPARSRAALSRAALGPQALSVSFFVLLP